MPSTVERQRRLLRPLRAGDDGQRDDLVAVLGVRHVLVDQRLDVLVVDVLLLVGQRLEAVEGVLQRVVAEFVAQLLQLLAEGVAAGMLAHDQHALRARRRSRAS